VVEPVQFLDCVVNLLFKIDLIFCLLKHGHFGLKMFEVLLHLIFGVVVLSSDVQQTLLKILLVFHEQNALVF